MQTIKLKVSEKVYDEFLRIIKGFNKNELVIIEDDIEFQKSKKYLEDELHEIENGKAIFLEEEEVYDRLENVIRKHEDNL